MTEWEGPYPPRSAPIRVDGGIRARTRRGAIGRSWWSRRFLEVLESYQGEGRQARGRSYARQGQVLALEITPGLVEATVQGSRAEPYQVRISVPTLPESAWATVERALADQAIFSAQLLAGEMPEAIEEVFTAAGAPLFPQRSEDVARSCSCPDPTVPCKHLAAACYLLAEAFDDDPFRILHWRGRDRGALLARLREQRDPAAPVGGPSVPGGPPTGAAAALAGFASPPLEEVLDRFWVPPVPLSERPPILATRPDLLLDQLPAPGPALGGPELVSRLRAAYRRFAAADDGDAGGGDAGDTTENPETTG